jgi:hypothetical protein
MLSRITEERLRIPAPVDPRAFGDELSSAQPYPRPDRPSLNGVR